MYAQQDVEFNLTYTFLQGKNVIKAQKDFDDPYVWVLTGNSEVYRINSTSFTIDDMTPLLQQYRHLEFTDIAAISKDRVYISTNARTVIELKETIARDITLTVPITAKINNLSRFGRNYYDPGQMNGVFIATAHGNYIYDFSTEQLMTPEEDFDSRVFADTHRSYMLNDPHIDNDWTGYTLSGVLMHTQYSWYRGNVWLNDTEFGRDVSTAYYTPGDINSNYAGNALTLNIYWATENGMFQVSFNGSARPWYSPHKSYLPGKKINKITSIFGLTAFGIDGNTDFVRENLLLATDEGLYFSNSGYNKYEFDFLNTYELFHYPGLGTKKINDLYVNNAPATPPNYCEDGVWVSAIDGLYYLKPDYGKYFNPLNNRFINFSDDITRTETAKDICTGTTVSLHIAGSGDNNNTVVWYRNGNVIPHQGQNQLTVNQGGDYKTVVFNSCSGMHIESNVLKVNELTATPAFTFNYPDIISACSGTQVTLKAIGNSTYQYRWYYNGVLTGNTTNELAVNQQGKYKVEVSACTGVWLPSKEVRIDFISLPVPVVSSSKPVYCAGETAALSTVIVSDPATTMNWYRDGVLLPLYQNTGTIQTHIPGKYAVKITSTLTACEKQSLDFDLKFFDLPTLSLQQTVNTTVCEGQAVSIAASYPAGNTILWSDGSTANHLTVTQAGTYSATVRSPAGCEVTKSISVQFSPKPALSITQLPNTVLCEGQPVSLVAAFDAGNTISWSTGSTSNPISITQAGTYTATVTSPNGCQTTESIQVPYTSNPSLNVQDATVCPIKNQATTITAPPGFPHYYWNGQPGSDSYTTYHAGDVTLTVEDQNGCAASQIIHVTEKCEDLHIPNAFTPNGDGINDTWLITGLNTGEYVTVQVYNRYGTTVFESKNYPVPWAGTVNGRQLPAGTYFYIIRNVTTNKTMTGSVSILY